ncbi:MAG: hypothetical protein ACJ74J_08085 [Blastocatellia bacterium]
MKIVKVVHAETDKQMNYEKQSFAIQTYNVESFVQKYLAGKQDSKTERKASDIATSILVGAVVGLYGPRTLRRDKDIRDVSLAMFESRRFNPNKIEQYILRNTYTETFDFDFDLAVRYLAVKADLKAEYTSISRKERLFHVEFSKA